MSDVSPQLQSEKELVAPDLSYRVLESIYCVLAEHVALHVGHGFDLHRLAEGYSLIIGGIQIPHIKACEAHSDGAVLDLVSAVITLCIRRRCLVALRCRVSLGCIGTARYRPVVPRQ